MSGGVNVEAFAERLKAARKSRGMTAQQLGEACGIDRSVIANIESGRRKHVDVSELVGFCSALQVGVTVLVPELEPFVPDSDAVQHLLKVLDGVAGLSADAASSARSWVAVKAVSA